MLNFMCCKKSNLIRKKEKKEGKGKKYIFFFFFFFVIFVIIYSSIVLIETIFKRFRLGNPDLAVTFSFERSELIIYAENSILR